ncbi:MAG: phage integrase SAM-like domain-containing protein [Saprospiraceae bacterium]|nr:phage integrase SAM-like domain-containing protein [Saprospiraceae bacterium]
MTKMGVGTIKQLGGKDYTIGTIKNYKNLLQALRRFEKTLGQKLEWDMITQELYYRFIKWHEEMNLSRNYIGKHIKDLKMLMKLAYEHGIHKNDEYKRSYFICPMSREKKIPLNIDELTRMEELQLPKDSQLSFARDVFLLGCYLGLRVSDIKRLAPKFVIKDKKGSCIVIDTQKTGIVVKIPISTKADKILQKYNYRCPSFWEQVVNRQLKKIAELIDLPKSRATTLSLHYSRCTFAKLSFELGIPSLYIMQVTGHTTEKNFLRYINITPDQAIKEFVKHEYFQ